MTLGLVGQLELDAIVKKAAEKKAKDDAKKGIVDDGPALQPAAEPIEFETHDADDYACGKQNPSWPGSVMSVCKRSRAGSLSAEPTEAWTGEARGEGGRRRLI